MPARRATWAPIAAGPSPLLRTDSMISTASRVRIEV